MKATSSFVASGLLIISSMGDTSSSLLIQNNDSPIIKNNTVNAYKSEYSKLLNRLYNYRNLSNNWDGYNGVKPSENIILTAESFIKILEKNSIPTPKIMVAGDGQIGLFWKNKSNYIEIDFDRVGLLSYFSKLNYKIHGEDDIKVISKIPDKLLASLNTFQVKNTITPIINKSFDKTVRPKTVTNYSTFVA